MSKRFYLINETNEKMPFNSTIGCVVNLLRGSNCRITHVEMVDNGVIERFSREQFLTAYGA